MFCCRGRPYVVVQEMIMSTIIENALDHHSGGSIQCIVQNGLPPYHIDWKQEGSAALIQLTPDRLKAINVPIGSYEISVQDSTGNRVEREVTVGVLFSPRISGYSVLDATGDTARDGKIVARVENMPKSKFLWTSGVITEGPTLYDVRPGIYSAVPISEYGETIQFIHASEPARVGSSRGQTAADI